MLLSTVNTINNNSRKQRLKLTRHIATHSYITERFIVAACRKHLVYVMSIFMYNIHHVSISTLQDSYIRVPYFVEILLGVSMYCPTEKSLYSTMKFLLLFLWLTLSIKSSLQWLSQ